MFQMPHTSVVATVSQIANGAITYPAVGKTL